MKRTRSEGLVYQPTYIDKRTGERKDRLDMVDPVLCQRDPVPGVLKFSAST
jgi:hypothetical protein